ncbi:DUF3459 domain-containing protein, partial [Nocardioides sp.]|uniref:DUF3459 domain-containing protein n=1 Tax=Nocardioides sp. TaxID=35761 RepID=UPI002D811088
FTPMLFQGEEWAASTPFCFFTSHPEPDLGRVTAEGRFAEFERMGWDPSVVPDPQDPATFRRSKLDWNEPESGHHARLLAAYRRLAELRRAHPDLTDPAFSSTSCSVDEEARVLRMRRGRLEVVVNFGMSPVSVPVAIEAELLFATGTGVRIDERHLILPGHAGGLVS